MLETTAINRLHVVTQQLLTTKAERFEKFSRQYLSPVQQSHEELPYEKQYSDLTKKQQAAAHRLGVTNAAAWDDSRAAVWKISWTALSDDQRVAAGELGFDEPSWDEMTGEEEATICGEKPVCPSSVGLKIDELENLRVWVRNMVDTGKWPHAITVVARRGRVCMLDVYEGEHEATRGVSTLHPDFSLFRLHSQTKPIIAAAALALVDRGQLSLEDSLSKHVPEFADAEAQGWPVFPPLVEGPKASKRFASAAPTVRQLLLHSAGIMPLDVNGTIERVISAKGYAELSSSQRLQAMCRDIAAEPLFHEPGADFLYAVQFDVLGRVLECASGQPLDVLLRELIFKPCGMESTFFCVPKGRRSDFRCCYVPDNFGSLVNVSGQAGVFKTYTEDGLGYFSGSEGLVSSAADFYRFAGMLLNGGISPMTGRRVLSEVSVGEMIRNQVPGDRDMSGWPSAGMMGLRHSGFGLGVSVAIRPNRSSTLGCGIGEYGWSGAANTHYFAAPSDGNLVVLLFTQVLQDPSMTVTARELRRAVYSSVVERE